MRTPLLCLGLSCVVLTAQANQLNYTPVNPMFGGSPLNGSWLQSMASAENLYTGPSVSYTQTPLQQFNSALQSAITAKIVGAITKGLTDANGNLVPQTVTMGNYSVVISNLPNNQVQITTTDTTTGASSSFTVYN